MAHLGCHGIPSRCFRFRGKPLPICARCVGVAVGEVLSVAYISLFGFPPLLAAIALCVPATIDWSLQEFLAVTSNNARRLFTGLLCGLGYGSLLIRLAIWAASAAIGLLHTWL